MIRRQPIETKIHHERWLVSYSDFITLLFAFFVVMYSVSHVNEQKYRQLSSTLDNAFSSGVSSVQDETSLDEKNPEVSKIAEVSKLADDLKEALAGLVEEDKISMSGNEQWVEIELNANLLFQSGRADVSNQARQLLSPVARILEPYENAIAIAGHTDDVPIASAQFPNNWALSSARAVSVVNYLAYQGVKPERLSAVGYGEYRPVVENSSDENRARNRRVVIKVAKNAVEVRREQLGVWAREDKAQETNENNDGGLSASETDQGADSNGPQVAAQPEKAPPVIPPQPAVDPVRLQGGGLLFSRDPDLPRSNPPVIIPVSPTEETAFPADQRP